MYKVATSTNLQVALLENGGRVGQRPENVETCGYYLRASGARQSPPIITPQPNRSHAETNLGERHVLTVLFCSAIG